MNKEMLRDLKTAVLFAVSFVFLAVVISVWQATIHWGVQVLAIGAYGLLLMKFFDKRLMVTFAGFAVMLFGMNYVWTDQNLENIWKIAFSIAVVLQLGSLGERKIEAANGVTGQ